MKTKISILFLVLMASFACSDIKRPPIKPTPLGDPGDVLLVVNDGIWQSAAGDSLRNMFAQPVEALPQDEPLFDVIRIRQSVFGKAFQTQRNIVIVKVGPDNQESRILVDRGLWARTQMVIGIEAETQEKLIQLIEDKHDKIVSLLLDAERKRLIDAYQGDLDPAISKTLRDDYNIILAVPRGFDMDVEKDNFIWITQEYRDILQGILIYTYPYTDKETFTREYLKQKRDSILRLYVPGEIEGSYMATEPLFPPLFSEYKLRNEKYTADMRGLWRMEKGMAMGGPFINLTQLDEDRNRIVTLDAYVFAPAHKKRDLLRQLEAIILTVDFTKSGEDK